MQHVAEISPVHPEAPDLERIEIETKNLDLSLKKLQLDQLRRSTVNWSIVLPIMSGVIAVISAVIVAYLNGRSQIEAEHYKSQTTLIVEAVKTGTNNPSTALNNLKFFADAGLLDEKVVAAVSKGKSPVLPSPTFAAAPGTTFQVVDRDLQHLHPLMRTKVSRILSNLKTESIPIALYEGFRDPMHQQYFYLQGRINREPIRTDDSPWRSLRQYGFAVTFGVVQNYAWSWKYEDEHQRNWWDRLKMLALQEGLELTGTEPAAYKLPGVTLDELIGGRYPKGDHSWADNLAQAISNWAGESPAPKLPDTTAQE
jgi:hypothetical protein